MRTAGLSTDDGQRRLVWDLPLRLFHWCLVASVAGSWLTHELGTAWFEWHLRIGYVTLVLVAFRIAWGFVGPRHARFSSFLRGPRATLAYLRGLHPGGGATTPGHNPLGGLGVLLMLALLLLQAVTGLFANDEIFSNGPLYGCVTDGQSDRLTGLHKGNSSWLLALFGLHVAAIAYYQLWQRVDLIRPMLTGRKPASQVSAADAISGHRLWLAAALAGIAAVFLWRLVATAPKASLSMY